MVKPSEDTLKALILMSVSSEGERVLKWIEASYDVAIDATLSQGADDLRALYAGEARSLKEILDTVKGAQGLLDKYSRKTIKGEI